MAQEYDLSPRASGLLDFGRPEAGPWVDYPSLGFSSEDIPSLIRIIDDHDLVWDSPQDSPVVYAAVHAWRAVAQLRGEAAIPALIGLIEGIDTHDDDWSVEELPDVFTMIGPASVPHLVEFLSRPIREKIWGPITASNSLEKIGGHYPEARAGCISGIAAALERFPKQDETLNAFLISDLAELRAVEAAPLVERAFATDKVDLFVDGDWEDFQVKVGLLEERITPVPISFPFGPFFIEDFSGVNDFGGEVPRIPNTGSFDKKEKKKRKQEKASRKRNRKRK